MDLLRDSLDDPILGSVNDELSNKVKDGTLPQQMFCMVEKTGELIDVEFDSQMSKCYYNASTKEYYKPISI